MPFLTQTRTLTVKNLLIVLVRHWFTTPVRAFVAPIIFMFFISYAKNFFVPPSTYGIGSPRPLLSLTDALDAATGGRNTVALVHNGHTGGQIESVITSVADTVRSAGKSVVLLQDNVQLVETCRSTLRGVTNCYAAAVFHGSPTEGSGVWNYTIRADGYFGTTFFADRSNNDAEIYILPLQHTIDAAIAARNGTTLPANVQQIPFSDKTNEERMRDIQRLFMKSLVNILSVAFFVGVCGVTYQLTGHMASERELGISQLIEAMVPNRRIWHTQAARLLALHLAFDIIYLPGWVIMGAIVARLVFPTSSAALMVVYHILAGLALTSFSIFGASLFRKAQLSGITVTLVSVILAIIAQVAGINTSVAVVILSALFPPMNYVFFFIWMARFEHEELAANLLSGAPHSPWQLPAITLWILNVLQIVVFPFLGALIERSLYGTASKARTMTTGSNNLQTIRISAFSKHYPPNWWHRTVAPKLGLKAKETVKAVNDLSIAAFRGEIMALLGANGSGKSTTLNAICGLHSITSGTIEIDGTGGLGYCPQKNVMWDELSVYEHVKIFNRLKSTGMTGSKDDILELISACDLSQKATAKSKTLSGGQKRKLQLAMMFTGGSRVCCVDEVSSGLDPLSRRKIWDILLAERGVRTMLLTTHFLDEADILADRIVVLSKGNLKAAGSAAQLKNLYGGGYRVLLRENTKLELPAELSNVKRISLAGLDGYRLSQSSQAASFVAHLERLGIQDYNVNGPTIEDVFLKLAEEIHETTSVRSLRPINSSGGSEKDPSDLVISETSTRSRDDDEGLAMTTGRGLGMAAQSFILFRKRFTILRRNFLPYVAVVLLPVATAGLVTLFLQGFKPLSCDPGAGASNPGVAGLNAGTAPLFENFSVPVGPAAISIDFLAHLSGLNASSFAVINSAQQLQGYLASNYSKTKPGGFFVDPTTPVFAYVGDWQMYWSVMSQNLFDSVLTDIPITTSFQYFAVPFAPGAGKTLQLVLYFGLAMSAYPAFFALYPTTERLRKVRALHYSNGIRSAPLWLAYLVFDFLFVMLISVLVTIIFASASSVWYGMGYLFVIFFLYGLTSILLSYIISLLVTSQLAAFAFSAGGQCVFYLLFFIINMSIITYDNPVHTDYHLKVSNYAFNTITPSGNLLRAMLLTLNEFSLLCEGHQRAKYPGAFRIYGSPILYLILQAMVFFAFLIWYESGPKIRLLPRESKVADAETNPSSEPVDSSVMEEAQRVGATQDPLKVSHVSKRFGSNLAVDNVTFGARHSEVFTLLGPNGAGKSTTISLIRGDLRPSRRGGDVLIEGTSINKHRAKARMNLGVCPQFDAMDAMTVYEHLAFYARARGVPAKDIPQNITTVLKAVGLEPYSTRMASKLSGGNKRKLSLAIALMGNPSVLLLDEPSSGMDAAAKRIMWKTLSAVTSGRALLITTHSMEEADALATRVGIMARKMLAVGTTEELRSKWGSGWFIHLVLSDPGQRTTEQMEEVAEWVRTRIPGAEVDGKMLHGQIRVRVHGEEVGAGRLFDVLEREGKGMGVEYYSIGRATLDQVFLEIVGRHQVREEGHEEEGGVGAKSEALITRVFRRILTIPGCGGIAD